MYNKNSMLVLKKNLKKLLILINYNVYIFNYLIIIQNYIKIYSYIIDFITILNKYKKI